jgi:hypothetical protein
MQPELAMAQKLQLGKEYPGTNEVVIAEKIIKLLKDEMLRTYPPGPDGKRQLRQIHPKMNGCVKAEVIIEKNLSPELRVGLFKEERSFPHGSVFRTVKHIPSRIIKKISGALQ